MIRKPVEHFLRLGHGLDRALHSLLRLSGHTQNNPRSNGLYCYNPVYFRTLAQNFDSLWLVFCLNSPKGPYRVARIKLYASFCRRLESAESGLRINVSIAVVGAIFFGGPSSRESRDPELPPPICELGLFCAYHMWTGRVWEISGKNRTLFLRVKR